MPPEGAAVLLISHPPALLLISMHSWRLMLCSHPGRRESDIKCPEGGSWQEPLSRTGLLGKHFPNKLSIENPCYGQEINHHYLSLTAASSFVTVYLSISQISKLMVSSFSIIIPYVSQFSAMYFQPCVFS